MSIFYFVASLSYIFFFSPLFILCCLPFLSFPTPPFFSANLLCRFYLHFFYIYHFTATFYSRSPFPLSSELASNLCSLPFIFIPASFLSFQHHLPFSPLPPFFFHLIVLFISVFLFSKSPFYTIFSPPLPSPSSSSYFSLVFLCQVSLLSSHLRQIKVLVLSISILSFSYFPLSSLFPVLFLPYS